MFSRLVYGKLRATLGGRCAYAVSAGAPLGERLGHFYRGIGLVVLEGYGLTETTAALTVNTPDAVKIGTVGRPIPGTTVRVADDGELLFRGGQVFAGYWGDEPATAEVLERDGWFHTGDLGEIDDEGFVRITGRKREILVTAGGKNVAPAVLEDRLRAHPLVDQCMVVGDGRPFIAALVTLDPESVTAWAEHRGKPTALTDLLDDADLRAELDEAVEEANKAVSQAEAIRRYAVLPGGLDRGGWPAHSQPQAQAGRRDARAPRRRRRPLRRLTPATAVRPVHFFTKSPHASEGAFTIREASHPRPAGQLKTTSSSAEITADQAQRWGVLGRPPGTERVTADGSPQDPPHHRRRQSPHSALSSSSSTSGAPTLVRRRASTPSRSSPPASPSPRARATTTPWPPARSRRSRVARSQLLANVQTSPDALKGTVALQNLFAGEQVVADKFGTNAAEAASPLGIPEGKMAISVNLTDPDRVAGFVNPGSEVAIFVTEHRGTPTTADRATAGVATDCCWIGSRCSASAARRRSPTTTTPRTAPSRPSSCPGRC